MRRLLIPLALAVGVLWWWAVLRLALVPEDSGAVEGAVAVGGWGLGLLPVHCTRPAARTQGPEGRRGCRGRWGGRGGERGRGGRRGGYQGIDTPPFGRRIWPVMKDEASQAR